MTLIEKLDERNKTYTHRMGLFLCPECGKEVKRTLCNGNRQKTCGCERSLHFDTGSRLWEMWRRMHRVCYEYDAPYHIRNFRDKGIGVCKEWYDNYSAFKKWAEENGYDKTKFLRRKDFDEDFSTTNCYFGDKHERLN